MSMHRAGFVYVYDNRTGEKIPNPVPEHYIGHPVLGRNLSLTPTEKAEAGKTADDTAPQSVPTIPPGPVGKSPASGDTNTNQGTTPKEK